MKVLVLEETRVIRDRLVSMLSELDGLEVSWAPTPPAGVAALVRAHAPDVLVADVHHVLAGALEPVRERAGSRRPALAVVLTNHVSDHHRRQCIERGADFFFDKSKQFPRVLDVLLAHRARLAALPPDSCV